MAHRTMTPARIGKRVLAMTVDPALLRAVLDAPQPTLDPAAPLSADQVATLLLLDATSADYRAQDICFQHVARKTKIGQRIDKDEVARLLEAARQQLYTAREAHAANVEAMYQDDGRDDDEAEFRAAVERRTKWQTDGMWDEHMRHGR